jgi:4-amino-4-deoxy-L-arabinose transferase-like glycosyltransferase
MDRDEPRFAQATVEMMVRGTWTIPYFNDEYRFDTPPLT